MLSQILRDRTGFCVMFKETVYISKQFIPSSMATGISINEVFDIVL